MAKRHHESRSNMRHHESRSGMIGHFRNNEHYAGMQDRTRLEREDGGMLFEDHRAVANLPQEVVIRAYPRTGPNMPTGLDDTIQGVDKQMDYDDAQRSRNFYPKKV